MIIFQHNLCIFVWISHGCLAYSLCFGFHQQCYKEVVMCIMMIWVWFSGRYLCYFEEDIQDEWSILWMSDCPGSHYQCEIQREGKATKKHHWQWGHCVLYCNKKGKSLLSRHDLHCWCTCIVCYTEVSLLMAIHNYSKTLVTQTLKAGLQWQIWTAFLVHNFSTPQENKYSGIF